MRAARLAIGMVVLGSLVFTIGLYAGMKQAWPAPQLRRLLADLRGSTGDRDSFGRLLRFPGKVEIPCPAQDAATGVLLVAGQSNAANYQGQWHQSPDDHVVNYFDGRCYRAASPLIGADGRLGETWTLLGMKLVRSGTYATVVLIPAAVGGSPIRRWANGGDLNGMLVQELRAVRSRYKITAVIWDQGAEDFALHTPQDRYRSDLKSLIDTIRGEGVAAPFFITRCTIGEQGWSEDNPIARAQASLVDEKAGVFDGPNTDHDLTPFDRYDGYHFAASGQEKYTDSLLTILRGHRSD